MIITVQDYFNKKIRSQSVSPIVSFDTIESTEQEKFEKKIYSFAIADILKEINSDYEDLLKRINVQLLNKLDDLYGMDINKTHVKFLNYFVDNLNEFFDKSDIDFISLLSIDSKDQEIIEILDKNMVKNISDDEEIDSILQEIKANQEEKAKLIIEVELARKLNKFKTENYKEIEKHLNFLVTEGNKKISHVEISLDRRIDSFNTKLDELNNQLNNI